MPNATASNRINAVGLTRNRAGAALATCNRYRIATSRTGRAARWPRRSSRRGYEPPITVLAVANRAGCPLTDQYLATTGLPQLNL